MFFGREKRLKDAANGFAIHAAAAVRYAQLHIGPGPNIDMLASVRFVQFDVARFYSQAPARSHGVTRRSEEHTSELQSRGHLVCRLLLERSAPICKLHSFPTRRSSDLEKRLKDAANGFAIHAAAAVRYAQLHIGPGPNIDMLASVRFVQFDVARFYSQAPARSHGVTRIGDQVQDDWCQLTAIDPNRAYLLSKVQFEMNAFPNNPSQQRLHVPENDV